jgi:hypothetical protein
MSYSKNFYEQNEMDESQQSIDVPEPDFGKPNYKKKFK